MLQGLPTQNFAILNLFYLTPDLLVVLQFLLFIIVGILMCRAIGLFATFLIYVVFLIILFFCLYVVGSFTAQVSSFDAFVHYTDFLMRKYIPFFIPLVASWGYFLGAIALAVKRKIFLSL
jgi:hypothetical protein